MKHLFMRWLTCMAAFVALAASSPVIASAADDPRFVYVAGLNIFAPCKSYASYWEDSKMYETAPGSNVYEGTFDFSDGYGWGGYFRFYYDLGEDEYLCWRQYNISPATHYDGGRLDALGRSGAGKAVDVSVDAMLPNSIEPGTWRVDRGVYNLRLDLNRNELYAVPVKSVLMLINDDTTPTLATLDNYVEIGRVKDYVAEGPLAIRLYDFTDGKWLNPSGSTALEAQGTNRLDVTASAVKGDAFAPTAWPGGVVTGEAGYSSYRVTLAADRAVEEPFEPISPDCIYVVGEFNYWSEFTAVPREAGDKAIYNVTLPACGEFKLVTGADWSTPEIVWNGMMTEAGDYHVMGLKLSDPYGSSSNNNQFGNHPDQYVTLVVNLTDGTLIVPKWADLNMGMQLPSRPLDRDVMLVATPDYSFTPWSGCSDAVFGSFQSLSRQADGTYAGRVDVPADKFNLRFISSLSGQGQPNTVIAPPTGKDRALTVVDGEAMSSAAALAEDKAGYWTRPDWSGGSVDITVTPGATPSVKFDFPAEHRQNCIYLIGSPQGWDISDGSMKLWATDRGGYYGAFNFAADDYLLFRFYTELGDWGNDGRLPAIGAAPNDGDMTSVIVDAGGDYIGSCTPGKGCWSLEGWQGGWIYMYVDMENWSVRFSASHIEEAGNILDPNAPQPVKEGVYVYCNGYYDELTRRIDGLYYGTISLDRDFRLFTRQLPISPEEAEWAGSYALSAPMDGFTFEFDEFGVAEGSFTAQNEVTTAGANSFRLDEDGYYSAAIMVDLDNNKVYIEKLNQVYYLVGAITGGETPTYATRERFRDVMIPRLGGKVYVPAGSMDFWFCGSISEASEQPAVKAEVSFDDGMACQEGDDMYGWMYRRVVCDGWHGGAVYVDPMKMLDLSTVRSVTAITPTTLSSNRTTLTETAPGSLKYEGQVPLAQLADPTLGQSLSFALNSLDDYRRLVTVGSNKYASGIGLPMNDGEQILVPADGEMSGKARFGGFSYQMPSLVGEGVLDVTLDLNTMTTTVKVADDNVGSIYETVSDSEGDLDGAVAYPSSTQEDAVTVAAEVSAREEGHEFNFTSPDGSVIEPESGAMTRIEFDADGSWSGKFTRKAAPSQSRAAVRAKAASEAKWHFDMPENTSGTVNMLIDENTSTLTVFSTAHIQNSFIVTYNSYMADVAPSIENLELLKQNVLKTTASGLLEGDFTVPAGAGDFSVAFVNSLYDRLDGNALLGISSTGSWSSDTVYDLSGETAEATKYAYATKAPYPTSATTWTVTAPAGKVHVVYNPAECTLTLSRSSSAIKSVSEDSAELTVIPGEGCVTVVAPADVRVDFRSLSGALVRSVAAPAGATTVEMPAGFYIVNRTKIFVK